MRTTARVLFATLFLLLLVSSFNIQAYAQTTQVSPIPSVSQAPTESSNNVDNYLSPNADSDVPENHHAYTQIVLIDTVSAFMCQLTGIDPTDPKQACLGVNPATGKISEPPTQSQTFGHVQSQPEIGGAVGAMTSYISALYVPAVSSTQYMSYLADNFGITKQADAATPAANNAQCSKTFGYGFCGLTPIFTLWTGVRDFAYVMLTVLFIAIGIGVMLRFRVDPRTVMTLQNQIPRVVVAILLITFSYAIAGAMIDIMWTATYAGINFITQQSNVEICIPTAKPLSEALDQRLNDDPLSFTNTIFRRINPGNNCNGLGVDSGILSLSSGVSAALGTLVTQTLKDLLGINSGCGIDLNPFHDIGCVATDAIGTFLLWVSEQIVKLIIIIALLIALFRLWFQLIKCYVTFLIFVIMGPLWIVFGLIPGRPLGFEKWLRIVFANLAVFPLVAFLLAFARVIVDAVPQGANPTNTFIPPLVGNPNISSFATFIGFGAIMLAPTVPDLIKERMKATGQAKFGASIAAGLGYAAGAATNPAKKTWESLNRKNAMTGEAEGSLAIAKQRMWQKTPVFGRRAIAKKHALHSAHAEGGDLSNYKQHRQAGFEAADRQYNSRREAKQQARQDRIDSGRTGWRRVRPHAPQQGGAWRRNPTPPPPPEASASSAASTPFFDPERIRRMNERMQGFQPGSDPSASTDSPKPQPSRWTRWRSRQQNPGSSSSGNSSGGSGNKKKKGK
jgi:hypothetical protein